MDGVSTIIVIILFAATIIGSASNNQGYTQPTSPPKEVVQTQITGPKVPNPAYVEFVGESPRKAILSYVGKYRKPGEAEAITAGIMKYSKLYEVNPKLVTALMARESRFNPRAVSSSGAIGLGQLLPSTCKTVGVSDPYDIDQNAKGTVRYMHYLLNRFKKYNERVAFSIAGYLEGPNAVERKLGYKPHTKAYIDDILKIYHQI